MDTCALIPMRTVNVPVLAQKEFPTDRDYCEFRDVSRLDVDGFFIYKAPFKVRHDKHLSHALLVTCFDNVDHYTHWYEMFGMYQ